MSRSDVFLKNMTKIHHCIYSNVPPELHPPPLPQPPPPPPYPPPPPPPFPPPPKVPWVTWITARLRQSRSAYEIQNLIWKTVVENKIWHSFKTLKFYADNKLMNYTTFAMIDQLSPLNSLDISEKRCSDLSPFPLNACDVIYLRTLYMSLSSKTIFTKVSVTSFPIIDAQQVKAKHDNFM